MSQDSLRKFAVYGSLRDGGSNHDVFDGRIENINKGVVRGFALLNHPKGFFPYAVEADDSSIVVDVVTVPVADLAEVSEDLNILEGFHSDDYAFNHYDRKVVNVETDDGIVSAWVYVMGQSRRGFFAGKTTVIESGDWFNQ